MDVIVVGPVEVVDDDEESVVLSVDLSLWQDQSVWEAIVVVVRVKVDVEEILVVVIVVVLVCVSVEVIESAVNQLAESQRIIDGVLEVN